MQIAVGIVLLLVCAGMVFVARPPAGTDSAPWLKSWLLGQMYVLAALVIAVIGVGFVLNGWPS